MPGPLHGLRVIDLTIDMAGPLAGMMLADAGAEVIKIEPPGGDPTSDRPGFVAWNRGKSRRTCDLDRVDDREALATLLDGADIVLVGTAPRALTYEQLVDRGLARSRGVWMIISPYLLTGTPWAGGEESAGLVFADMGHAWSQSSYDDVPVDCVYPLIPCLQGIWAAAVAVAAARSHRRDGRARTVAVGAAQAGVMVSPGAFSRAVDTPVVHPPGGPGGSLPNYRCYRGSDGEWLFLGAYTAAFIRRALGVLGLERLLDDPRMDGDPSSVRLPGNFSWIVDEFDRRFATQPRSRWLELLEAADVPVAPALATADWLQHPQVLALGLREERTDDAGRHIVMPGPPIRFSATPAELGGPASGRAPGLGAEPLSWSVTPPGARLAAAEVTAEGTPPPSFLADVRVVDLGTIIAGPYAATLLAELGAEVIKVERPPHGDEFRTATGGQGRGGFTSYNRNQLGMAVDLRAAPGRVAFDALLDETDVVVDNFRPGVLERLGMDWTTLAANRPGLVSVSISAFGGVGPLGTRPGFDPVVQALSGIMRTQGGADPADSPAFLTVPINDVLAAALGTFGVCAALHHRDTTGRGQQIDVPLVASSCLLQIEQLIEIDGERTLTGGNRDFCGPTPLNRLYQAKDGWLRLDGHWPSDVTKMQAAGLLSAAGAGRDESLIGDQSLVAAELAETIGRHAVGEVVERANAAGVPAGPARTLAEVGHDERLRRDGVTSDGDDETRLMEPGRWYEIPGRPARPAGPAPTYGQHTTRLLRRLDFDDALIAELFRFGAVAGE
jgi:crotonobetainyl-CoA:carnitine CoA-transferase CaiB-like acyl-CoA transferase